MGSNTQKWHIPIKYRKRFEGRCAQRLIECPSKSCDFKTVHSEWNKVVVEGCLCPKCDSPLFCMEKMDGKTIGSKGYDSKNGVYGDKCVNCMNKKERKAYFNMKSNSGPAAIFTGELLEQFQKMEADPNFTAIKQNGVIANIRLMQLLSLVDEKAPPSEIWRGLRDTWKRFEEETKKVGQLTARANKEIDRYSAVDANTQNQLDEAKKRQMGFLSEIGAAISDGVDISNIWDEVLSVNEQVAQLKERETRRRQMIGAMMEPDEIAEFFGFLRQAIEHGITEDLIGLKDEGILPEDTPLEVVKSMLLRSIGGRIQTQIQRLDRHTPQMVLDDREFRQSLVEGEKLTDNTQESKG